MRSLVRWAPLILMIAVIASLLSPRGGQTVPLYAARTGLMCQSCHFDPNGGGPRNEFGFAYARQRHDLAPEDSNSTWATLNLTNRIGDAMPVYLGVDQRFMVLANTTFSSDSLDRLGFFNMENALYLTFQPHQQLTLVYSRDGFNRSATTQDAFGMISGLPFESYLKAGRFRTPFGLRQDDHTVATRNGFLDFESGEGFLPYDPRVPDMGLEYGLTHGPLFGRVAYTNGSSNVFGGQYASACTAKLGMNRSFYQGGFSFYDDFTKQTSGGTPFKRATRWGYYGMTHWKRLAMLGEIAAGTDQLKSGDKVNRLAGYAEVDYAPRRWANLRVRYDYLALDRSTDSVLRDLGTTERWALEGEFVPVPFAEIRVALRAINPTASNDPLSGDPIPNERQAYVQFHFSY